ncbi:MAG TPA: GIY-YIG nuclease family protein [Opitutaceae bacterium]
MPCVYLLAIDPPYQGKHHYIGFSHQPHPEKRLREHQAGRGGKFTSRVIRAGCKLTLIMHWSAPSITEKFERYLKERADTKYWCPHCKRNERAVPTMHDYDPSLVEQYYTKLRMRQMQKATLSDITADREFREQFGDGRWA